MRSWLCNAVVPAALALLLAGCAISTEDIPAVRDFDADRYQGRWYEIARLPNSFEEGMEFVCADYMRLPNTTIRVINSAVRNGRKHTVTGVAQLKDRQAFPPVGELEVSFGGSNADYRIIELSPDYGYAVVTGSTRDYLWILSRRPHMNKELLENIKKRLAELNFDIEKLEYPRQKPLPPPPHDAQPKPVEPPKPVVQPKPVEQKKPVVQPKPVEQKKPVVQPKPVEPQKPAVQPKPVEPKKPAVQPKPVEPKKPVVPVQPKPVEPKKPAVQPKPVEPKKPVVPVQPKPVEPKKPAVQPKPVEPQKPVVPVQPKPVEPSRAK